MTNQELIALLDRAIESIGSFCSDQGWATSDMDTLDDLIAARAEAAQPAHWTDSPGALERAAKAHHAAIAAREAAQPAAQEPRRLTDAQIGDIVREASKGAATRRDGTTSTRIARAVEAALAAQPAALEPRVTAAMLDQLREHYEQALATGRTLAQVRASLEAAAQEPDMDPNDAARRRESLREQAIWDRGYAAAVEEMERAQPAAQEPLTEAQIGDLINAMPLNTGMFTKLVRSVEKAHGIGSSQ